MLIDIKRFTTSTISNIGQEITEIISSSKSISTKISEEERINHFLDSINKLRIKLTDQTQKIQKLDELLSKLTWHNLQNKDDEDLMKMIIIKSLSFHSKLIRNFASLNKSFFKDNICRVEISKYKNTIDDFEESIYEVKEIFFNLRKDSEFNDLMNSL